jgi:hypothetical protein
MTAAALHFLVPHITPHPDDVARELFATEQRATPQDTRLATVCVILTTPQGYADALALLGEAWSGTLTPTTIALSAPFPDYSEHAADLAVPDLPRDVTTVPVSWQRTGLPDGSHLLPDFQVCGECEVVCPDGTPYCSSRCREKAGAAARPPLGKRYPITSAESQHYIDSGEWPDDGSAAGRRAQLLAARETLPSHLCEGERDENNRACCTGDDVRCVTYIPGHLDADVAATEQRALWCFDCRMDARVRGDILVRSEDPA